MIYSKNKRSRLEGPGIAVRTRKPGPTGADYPNSLFMRTDQTDYVFRMKQVRRRVLAKTYGGTA